MITLERAKELPTGTILHHVSAKNADKTPQRFKVTSVKKWKKKYPGKVRIGLKRGLYEYGTITEGDLGDFTEE